MRFADRFGLSMGPLVLRVLLAVTFIWAGLGKVLTTIDVGPEDAARLAQMKVAVAPPPPPPSPSTSPATPEDAAPSLQLPEPDAALETESAPTPADEPADGTPAPSTGPSLDEVSFQTPSFQTRSFQTGSLQAVSWVTQQAATTAQPADFPDGARVRSLYGLALLIDSAADPGLDDESNLIQPIWPAALAKGSLPKSLAWLAAVAEIALGVTLLLGLLTRLSALSVAGIMGTAAWLTQIGPAIQDGNPRLGFLPTHDVFDIAAWQPFAWQMSLFFAAIALICLGSGAIGLDRALFRRREDLAPAAPHTPHAPDAPQPAPGRNYREAEATPDYDPAKNPFKGQGENDES
ncbi:MAG: putative membrane protein YphA (DoxX/SURF4 family) [Phycisphaerales bacterium]|jgi:uncharacterized membrane protein YphA (DoxX/SURF4 family)